MRAKSRRSFWILVTEIKWAFILWSLRPANDPPKQFLWVIYWSSIEFRFDRYFACPKLATFPSSTIICAVFPLHMKNGRDFILIDECKTYIDDKITFIRLDKVLHTCLLISSKLYLCASINAGKLNVDSSTPWNCL
jgi:hypothetical protein